jgi:dipeptidyl aminopeptidase/acylaminoacyl peptidase
MSRVLTACAMAVCLFAATANAQTTPAPAAAHALSATDFTASPALWSASLSPSGQFVAAIQHSEQGDSLIIVNWRTREAHAIQTARADQGLHLDWVRWKNDNRVIFAGRRQSDGGYEVTRVFAADRDGQNPIQLFGAELYRLANTSISIRLIDLLPNDPTHVLLGTWGQRGYTVYRADITNGRVQALEDAEWYTFDFIVDSAGNPVMRQDVLPKGTGIRIYRRASGEHHWTLAYEARRTQQIGENREFVPLAAAADPGKVYVAARPEGQEYQSIYMYDTATGQLGDPVFHVDGADAQIAWLDTQTRAMLIGCAETQRWECHALDPAMQRHFDGISAYFQGAADISLVSTADDLWLIYAEGPTIPGTYYVYDRSASQISVLGSSYPHLPRNALAPTQIVQYTARDGAHLWGYLTAQDAASGPRPMVVLPHGGPESRDEYGFDFFAQFLASRGYVVFQPNFRGSEGSGRSFAAAGHGQWGRKMQDDISDGVERLVHAGIADRHKVCIVGASYGGYAALAGLTLTPDLYRCGVSIAGVSDLVQMLSWEHSDADRRSSGLYDYFVSLIGDPNTDRDELIAVSPARQAAHVTAPLLLIHGDADDIVNPEQSAIMNRAMHAAGKDVQYDVIQGEGHIWSDWSAEDRTHMLEEVETFLAQNIGPGAPEQ